MDELFDAIETDGETAADDDFAPGDSCAVCADLGDCSACGRV